MNYLLFIGLILCWATNAIAQTSAVAQTSPTQLYFLNTVNALTYRFKLQVAADDKKNIQLGGNRYQMLTLPADSLTLFMDDEPRTVQFERGRSYYFVATLVPAGSYVLKEMPAYQFWLTVSLNKAKKQEPYGIMLSR